MVVKQSNMATEVKKIISRRDTAANWQSNNPVLANGEIGIDTTNKEMKIGDGTTKWASLTSVSDRLYQGLIGSQYLGVASPSTIPPTTTQKCFYLACAQGTYDNHGGIIVLPNERCLLMYSGGAWTKLAIPADTRITELFYREVPSSKIVGGFIESVGGNLTIKDTGEHFTVFYDVSEGYVTLYASNEQSVLTSKLASFFGAGGTSISGPIKYLVGENRLKVPDGAVQLAVTATFKGAGSADNIKVLVDDKITDKVNSLLYNEIPAQETKYGFIESVDGNFLASGEGAHITSIYPVKGDYVTLYASNEQSVLTSKLASFFGAGGTSISGPIKYLVGENRLKVPDGAVQLAVTATFKGAGSADNIKVLVEAGRSWAEYTWLLVGDSLTEKNRRAALSYYDYIALDTGVKLINKGHSGLGYASGDYFYNVAYQSGSLDYDFATIFGSVNDIRYEEYPSLSAHPTFVDAMGDIYDTGDNTICGKINRTIDLFIANQPLKKLGIVTPTPCYGITEEAVSRLKLYSEKLVQICRNKGLPCLDLFTTSGLRPWNETFRENFYKEGDVQDIGVHPNSKGHRWIKNMFEEFIRTYLIDA